MIKRLRVYIYHGRQTIKKKSKNKTGHTKIEEQKNWSHESMLRRRRRHIITILQSLFVFFLFILPQNA